MSRLCIFLIPMLLFSGITFAQDEAPTNKALQQQAPEPVTQEPTAAPSTDADTVEEAPEDQPPQAEDMQDDVEQQVDVSADEPTEVEVEKQPSDQQPEPATDQPDTLENIPETKQDQQDRSVQAVEGEDLQDAPQTEPAPEAAAQDDAAEVPEQPQQGQLADQAPGQEPSIEPEVPTMPEPEQEGPPVEQELEEVEPEGIDTVDINEPEGNWLFKRIWWEKSKELFGKIRNRVDNIVESRMHFFKERVKLERDLIDPFYTQIGLDQGALQGSVDQLLDLLKKEREQEGILDPEEVSTYNRLVEQKTTIEQLAQSVASIRELDNGLDAALNKLMEQINLARSYERQAWGLLNEIAEQLSDKKAREHYYTIATLWRNVKDIARYIEGPFAQHFVQLAQLTMQNIQAVNQSVEMLKAQGIEVKETIEIHDEHDDQQEEEPESEPETEPKKEQGWFAWLWQKLTWWWPW